MSPTPDQTPPPNRKVIGTETQKLRVDLTESEIKRANENLIGCLSELAAHEREATEVKAQLARKQKGLEAKRGNLHQLIVAGYEYRDVEVEKIADYDRGLIMFCRVDTGAEVDVERMPEGVRQQELDLREKRDAEANRPTNPDDVVADVDPWGAPSDGRPPVAEQPHDPDVIDAEFVEGDGLDGDEPDDDDADPETQDEGAAAAPTGSVPPAAPDRSSWMSKDDESAAGELVVWMRAVGPDATTERLESSDVDEVRDIYRYLTDDATQQRAQKRTLIPKIIEALFPAVPF